MTQSLAFQRLIFVISLLFILLLAWPGHGSTNAAAPAIIKAEIKILPALGLFKAKLDITWPAGAPRTFVFLLNKKLNISSFSSDDNVQLLKKSPVLGLYNEWLVTLSDLNNKLSLSYSGTMFTPMAGGSFIDSKQALLSSNSGWLPANEQTPFLLDILVQTPRTWSVISQGQQVEVFFDKNFRWSHWKNLNPQISYSLFAGPWAVTYIKDFNVFTPSSLEKDPLLKEAVSGVVVGLTRELDQWDDSLGSSHLISKNLLVLNNKKMAAGLEHQLGLWLTTAAEVKKLYNTADTLTLKKWTLDSWFLFRSTEPPYWAKTLKDFLLWRSVETEMNLSFGTLDSVSKNPWFLLQNQLKAPNFDRCLQLYFVNNFTAWNLEELLSTVVLLKPELSIWLQKWQQLMTDESILKKNPTSPEQQSQQLILLTRQALLEKNKTRKPASLAKKIKSVPLLIKPALLKSPDTDPSQTKENLHAGILLSEEKNPNNLRLMDSLNL